jgi:hypothetical protein
MNRYGQNMNKKKSPVLLVIVVFFIVSAIWLYITNQADHDTETKPIDIPEGKKSAIFENQVLLNDNEEKTLFSEEKSQNEEGDNNSDIELKPLLLEDSDESFKKSVKGVSENFLSWFNIKHVIRKYLIIINDLSQNQILYKHRKFLKIPQRIIVKNDSHGLYLAKESYGRYNLLADAIASIDTKKGIDLYVRFKPLFEQVYEEFGYPEEYRLEDIFMKAAANVLKAPRQKGRINLVRHSLRYKFADKKLEALNNVEKQMLRMGPDNTKKIQAKLRQLATAIAVLNE